MPHKSSAHELRLTDLPKHVLVLILRALVSDSLHSGRTLLRFPCVPKHNPSRCAEGLHTAQNTKPYRRYVRQPFPEVLLNVALVSRSFAAALGIALGSHAIDVDSHDILNAPFIWLLVCAPVMKTFSASAECMSCVGKYQERDVFLLPRILGAVAFPSLLQLDLRGIWSYKCGEFTANMSLQLQTFTKRLILNIAGTVENLAIPCHPAFIVALDGAIFLHLRSLEIAYRCLGVSTPGSMEHILCTLAASNPRLILSGLTLSGLRTAPELSTQRYKSKFQKLSASISSLHLLLAGNTHVAWKKIEEFLSSFPALRTLILAECSKLPNVHSILLKCSHLQRIAVDYAFQNGWNQQMTVVNDNEHILQADAMRDIEQLEGMYDVARMGQLELSLRLLKMHHIASLLQRTVPLHSICIAAGKECIDALLDLCSANRGTLKVLTVTYIPGELDETGNEIEKITKSQWKKLVGTVSRLSRLSDLALRSPDGCTVCHNTSDLMDIIEACLAAMNERARVFIFEFACETAEFVDVLIPALCRGLRCVRRCNPNLESLSLRLAKDKEASMNYGGMTLEEIDVMRQDLLLQLHKTVKQLPNISDVGWCGEWASDFLASSERLVFERIGFPGCA